MEKAKREENLEIPVFESKTFSVPFDLGEIKDSLSISTNRSSKLSEEQLIKKAINFHLQGNISEAKKYYELCISKGIDDPRIFTNYGIILNSLGKTKEAEISTRKAIQLNPKLADAHSNLGNILRDLGKLKEAELYTRKAISLKPKSADAHSNLGNILKDLGKLEEAESSIRKAIQLKPDFANAYSNLGNTLKDLGKLEEAESSIRKAIQLKPDFANAYSYLGNTLKDLGKLEEAELSIRKAIKIDPNYADAYSNLGVILKDLGKLEEAELSIRKAIKIDPNYANAYSNLGDILIDLGKLEEAEAKYYKAMVMQPLNKYFENNFIRLLTIHEPSNSKQHPFSKINNDFKKININDHLDQIISDTKAIEIYKKGLVIYQKYNLDLETSLSQIYNRNERNLNCRRHKLIFEQYKIIPEFCFGCYKVQVEVNSIIELIKLFLVFNNLELDNNNTRKTLIEIRPAIEGFYKGLIYCLNLNEAIEISNYVNTKIKKSIRIDLISKVKRGCSEYSQEYSEYKEIRLSGSQPMIYNQKWKIIEQEVDQGNKSWGKSPKSIQGFNINDFLIIRNWIAYAQKIGDQSVKKITNEKIKGPKRFHYLNRNFQ